MFKSFIIILYVFVEKNKMWF